MVNAQQLKATWQFSDPEDWQAVSVEGDAEATASVTTSISMGSNIAETRQLTASGADAATKQ